MPLPYLVTATKASEPETRPTARMFLGTDAPPPPQAPIETVAAATPTNVIRRRIMRSGVALVDSHGRHGHARDPHHVAGAIEDRSGGDDDAHELRSPLFAVGEEDPPGGDGLAVGHDPGPVEAGRLLRRLRRERQGGAAGRREPARNLLARHRRL